MLLELIDPYLPDKVRGGCKESLHEQVQALPEVGAHCQQLLVVLSLSLLWRGGHLPATLRHGPHHRPLTGGGETGSE